MSYEFALRSLRLLMNVELNMRREIPNVPATIIILFII